MKKIKAPAGLDEPGRKLWDEISGKYELRADELCTLEEACREVDLIARLDDALDGASMMVAGSMGQQVVNPLLGEVRQHRGVLARLLGYLRLPDDSEGTAEARSTQARAAANARWSRRGA